MDRHKDRLRQERAPGLSSHLVQSDRFAEDGLGGRDAEADNDARLHHLHFRLEPGPAGGNLGSGRLFVLAPLALRLPLEVLHGVGDVDVAPRNPGFGQGLVQDLARRADEGMAGLVLLIAGLLADEDDRGLERSFSEDGLRGLFIEIATGTGSGGLLQMGDGQRGRKELGG